MALMVDDENCIEAAAFHGVQRTTLSALRAENSEVQIIDYPVPYPQHGIEAVQGQLNKPYDWAGVLGLWLHQHWANASRWWCSELCNYALFQAGLVLFRPTAMARITPGDMWNINVPGMQTVGQ
jgi:hypothetical protein